MEKRKRKPGGGRKPTPGRKVNRSRAFYLFEDQAERVTPDEVRAAVDNYMENKQTMELSILIRIADGESFRVPRDSEYGPQIPVDDYMIVHPGSPIRAMPGKPSIYKPRRVDPSDYFEVDGRLKQIWQILPKKYF